MLSKVSTQCLQRLRQYKPGPSVWNSLPLSRRAAVLVLLFPDAGGGLRIVLTMRGALLSSFSGHVAFPGGKADFETETEFAVARREAEEEIGLPRVFGSKKYVIEELASMPTHLARNFLCVRPCVAFVRHADASDHSGINLRDLLQIDENEANVEVGAVFSGPFERFLHNDKGWYDGQWVDWYGLQWRQHRFTVNKSQDDIIPARFVNNNNVASSFDKLKAFTVWGLTARVLVDVARLGYGREPEMEYSKKDGDELLITKMIEAGMLGPNRTKQDLKTRFNDFFDKELLSCL
ncbi:NUDIX hydrolase domain-like protein [Lipomyces japonicus]|uniref:NUDIX hydrolase domain-like protein n=1 Tax=Lipomyces japonicus TaxID=56871 RepID=UPI0034CE8257